MNVSGTEGEIRAFVAGASGYTGREVVLELLNAGATAVAHIRPDSPRLKEARQRFARAGVRVDTTAWNELAMTATLTTLRPTHIFALLGTTRARAAAAAKTGALPADYEAVDYGLTALLLRAAVAAARATALSPRFVYLSALGASAVGNNAYMRVRGRVEKLVHESTLPYLIVRPAIISGPDREERRPLERLAAIAADRSTALLGALGAHRVRARYRPRSGREMAASIVRLALAGRQGIVESEEL